MKDLSAEDARSALHYNHLTGDLIWLPIPREYFASLRAANAWNTRFPGKIAGNTRPYGYRRVSVFDQIYESHRVCWLIYYGEWPVIIDHINHDPGDNRIVNLRSITQSINLQNASMRTDNTSGFNGVSRDKRTGRWEAHIRINDKKRSLGYFADLNDAIAARVAANREYNFHPNHGVNL